MSYKEQNSLDCIKINQELGELCIEFEKKLAEREWVSVKERLPASEQEVLFFLNHEIFLGYRSLAKWWIKHDQECRGFAYRQITHWMPLPDPPEKWRAG